MKRNTARIFILLVGVLTMLFNLFGCSGNNQGNKQATSGTCGENMTWEYNKRSQTLTISGSGEMVTTDRFMWSDYKIKNLVISEGVASIAGEAFYSNHQLQGKGSRCPPSPARS